MEDPRTDRMRLLEEKAGKPIRAVLSEAYEVSDRNIVRAANWLTKRYGVKVSFGIFSDWVKALDGKFEVQRSIRWDEEEAGVAA
jgi:hypothetical protein